MHNHLKVDTLSLSFEDETTEIFEIEIRKEKKGDKYIITIPFETEENEDDD